MNDLQNEILTTVSTVTEIMNQRDLTILFPISTHVTIARSPLQTNRHVSDDG